MGAADRGGAATGQDTAQGAAPDHRGIFWRHRNGATWRAIPAELGPWWQAAQLFIRWAEAGAWERLLELAQDHAGGLELGLAFLDGTNIRAHAKAAGAPKKGDLAQAETSRKPRPA